MTAPRPFKFDDFNTSPEAPQESRVRSFTVDDLAAARGEGVAEGRRLAMETIAADETMQLARIGDALAGLHQAVDTETRRVRTEIFSIARLFVEEFAEGLAQEREIEAADAMLRRLTENSEDRRAATLVLNAKSHDRLRARLEEILNLRGVADFVSLDGDQRLAAGEIRLEWRGGAMARGRAEIRAAVAALFDPLSDDAKEASDERA